MAVMLIARDQEIAGRPAVEVRGIMRMMHHAAFSVRGLALQLGIDDSAARSLVKALREAGLIEPPTTVGPWYAAEDEGSGRHQPKLWTTTIAGAAVGKARIGVPMPRAKAQALLDEVLERVEKANASDEWLHWVERVVLYGSFARDGDAPVGDIDLAVFLEPRCTGDEFLDRQYEMIDRDGARPSTFAATVLYAHAKLLRFLQGRSPRVDLADHTGERPLPPDWVGRTVYSADRSTDASESAYLESAYQIDGRAAAPGASGA